MMFLKPESFRFYMKINKVNSVLKGVCAINGFTFTDNANINNSDTCDDHLHLTYSGTGKLANNFINVINKMLVTRNVWQSTVAM